MNLEKNQKSLSSEYDEVEIGNVIELRLLKTSQRNNKMVYRRYTNKLSFLLANLEFK